MSDDDVILKVAALKAISAFTTERYNEARQEAAKVMQRGDRRIARSPLDEAKVGAVSMSDPKATARVSDLTAITDWLTENYPEHIHSGYEVNATDEQVMRVLFEHAPHMLRKVKRAKPEVLSDLTKTAAVVGKPVGPGGEMDIPGIVVERPDPVVSCKPDEATALTAVMDLIRAERIGIDGTVRPELPASEEQA